MKKLLAFLLALLLTPSALAEFDLSALRDDPGFAVIPQHGTVNTIYRANNQPFIGQADEGFDGEVVAYVDYIHLVDQEVTLLYLTVCTTVYDSPLNGEKVRLTVGGKHYTFEVEREVSEYDGIYMEDFSTCLTDASLPLLKAIAQQKRDNPIPVTVFCGEDVVFTGLVLIPGDDAAKLYDQFVRLGGKTQALKTLDDAWPCTVESAK